MASNLVILGEAGMGKSRLLEELSVEGAKFVTAQRLVNSADPAKLVGDARWLLVDAVDEASAFKQGEAVNLVLSRIEQSGVPRFILSCRAEDWQAATSASLIAETFGAHPLELTLKPLFHDQILSYLTAELGHEKAIFAEAEYRKFGLTEWLGNPQTLLMVAEVIKQGRSPHSTSQLFSDYVELSLPEANDARRSKAIETTTGHRKDILGVAFAALILSGKTALARPGAPLSDEDLRLSELGALAEGFDWDMVSGNRLIRILHGDPNRLTYSHRRIGEWLAARWLAHKASDPDVRDRLLSALIVNGIVPASLRGLFGWLAQYPGMSEKIISTDPLAVIEYGDADGLAPKDAIALLDALDRLAQEDPYFAGWHELRAKSLVSETMRERTLGAIRDPNRNARLRLLLASQFKGEKLPEQLISQLRSMTLDPSLFYALREEVSECLVGNVSVPEFVDLIETLRRQGSHDATRLASNLLLEVGVGHFADEVIVEAIMADCGHTICAIANEGEDTVAAKTWRYRRDIPDERCAPVLDTLADYATSLLPEYRSVESSDIINLGDALISRALAFDRVEPERLLCWLSAFGGRDSYIDEDTKSISQYLRDDAETRRAIQTIWFDRAKDESDFFGASYQISQVNRELPFSDDDLAHYLSCKGSDYPMWETAVRQVRHSAEDGVQTRATARRFFTSDAEYEAFVDSLLNPPPPHWQAEQDARSAKRQSERDTSWAKFREGLAADEEGLRQARFGVMHQVANVYFGRYSDLRELKSVDDRLEALCGPEMVGPVLAAFETYLNILPPYPHAALIAGSYGENKGWSAQYILLAALAERVRSTGSLGYLDEDQLLQAQLHFSNHALSSDEWKDVKDAVWAATRSDARIFERFARLLFEPSLARKKEHVAGSHELLTDGAERHPKIVSLLAAEWLERFPDMHFRPEAELMDVLLSRGHQEMLAPLVSSRLGMEGLDEERLRNWQAASLICDFESASVTLGGIATSDPSLFWAIRSRLGARRPYDTATENHSLELSAWMVEHFRAVLPLTNRPSGVTMGETNPWDGSEAISRLIDRIGTDTSKHAGDILERLANTHDAYRERALAVLAEHRRKRAELARITLSVDGLASILSNGPPRSLPDLRTRMMQLFDRVEAQAKNSPTDSWVAFYRDDLKTPHGEERCRDRIIEMLRQHDHDIQFSPEKHLGLDREGDIACEIAGLHLPIEVKGQWHDDLWTAADAQLAVQQASDHLAGGYGIYLVLWFGPFGKPLKGPPKSLGISKPQSPSELAAALTQASKAAREGEVVVRVLDLSRG
ncbi:MAG: hypothetical protein H2055_02790 [Sphingopyxis sp.]|nr:hypothetical protein [Sphingopyxis sp.]